MRKNRENQLPLTPLWPDHQLSYELQMISRILDDNPEILDLVLQDLSDKTDPQKGSPGLSAEQVLRCAVLKTWQQLSYQKLAFHLADSISLRAFCRLPLGWTPCKSCLQDNISRIRASSWEKINRVLIRWAAGEGLEKGKKIRVDATAVESDIHHPSDSQLLYDSIRTLTALLRKLKEHHPVVYSDHCRRAKRRCTNIRNTRGQARKKPLYQDLLKVAAKTAHYTRVVLQSASQWEDIPSLVIVGKLRHYLHLMQQVIKQTERRVLQGEKVPAAEKVVSIFEEHTDIIQTGGRETTFGHKIFLTCGKTSLLTDCLVLRGNPADSAQMNDWRQLEFPTTTNRIPHFFRADPDHEGMVKDQQVRRLVKLQKNEKTLTMAAAKAGLSRKTARKYLKSGKLPSQSQPERYWRTRSDPFESVWPEVEEILKRSPTVEATAVFEYL